jgi:hypothetical protein
VLRVSNQVPVGLQALSGNSKEGPFGTACGV